MQLSAKQLEVLDCAVNANPKILVCSGAKRAGKTYIMILLFLIHIEKYRNKGYSFIIGGTTQASIRRNILNDMEVILGKELVISKSNAIEIFGNKVYVFDGANADSFKKLRGFTSFGAFLNEATTLHDTFVKETISRCSGNGARIYMDTNPENPMHTVKVDYIDKDGQRLNNGQLNIKAFQFTLFDNEFLNEEYIESIIASTPSGMFYDRDIKGIWVAAEGVVYKDFNQDIHYIQNVDNVQFKKYFAGVDFGYEHYGSMVVIGEAVDGCYYLLQEYSAQHKEIDYWVDVAKEIKQRYGSIIFYCDHARPEHIARLNREGFMAANADKSVLSGIEVVAKLFKLNQLYIVEPNVNRFKQEIFTYVWSGTKDEPIKQNDDVLDSLRYALYSNVAKSKLQTMNKLSFGL